MGKAWAVLERHPQRIFVARCARAHRVLHTPHRVAADREVVVVDAVRDDAAEYPNLPGQPCSLRVALGSERVEQAYKLLFAEARRTGCGEWSPGDGWEHVAEVTGTARTPVVMARRIEIRSDQSIERLVSEAATFTAVCGREPDGFLLGTFTRRTTGRVDPPAGRRGTDEPVYPPGSSGRCSDNHPS